MKRRHKWFLRGLLIVCALLLCEAALRLCGYSSGEGCQTMISGDRVMRPVPGVPYLFKPYASFTEQWSSNPDGYFQGPSNSITYRINNYGFRGRDMLLERTGNIRVAFVGDSFCWGLGVKDEDHFLEVIAVQLAAAGMGAVELYNFAMPGFDTVHEVALTGHVVARFRPDICVMWYFLNDIGGGSGLVTINHLGGDDLWKTWRRRVVLLDLLAAPLGRLIGEHKLIDNYRNVYTDGSPQLARLDKLLTVFSDLCKANGMTAVLAVHPILYRLDENYPFAEAHQKVLAIAREKGIIAIDLFPYFQGLDAETLWVHPLDQHPNYKAHKIVADGFGKELCRIVEQVGEKKKHE